MPSRPLLHTCAVVLALALFTTPLHAQIVLDETFSGAASGWTVDTEWQIGPTSVGPPTVETTYPDPAQDHSPSADNRVAGTVLGGNIATFPHAFRWLEGPAVNVAGWPGAIQLRFWRWLNVDNAPFVTTRVEVFNGSAWVTIWQNGSIDPVTDNAWVPMTLNLTAYRNAGLRVRFGYAVAFGASAGLSGWNIDDVQIEKLPCADNDGDGHPGIACGGDDCNDANPAVHPGAPEICDGLDNDCNTYVDDASAVLLYRDEDGDGYGRQSISVEGCFRPPGYVPFGGDCNDADAHIHPGAIEACQGIDDDCDQLVDEGCAFLTIESIRDVPNDQGRNVRLTWVRSAEDSSAFSSLTGYTVWRRIANGLAGSADARIGDQPPTLDALPPGAWDFIASVPAIREQRYHIVVPTLCDSNAAGRCWTILLVRALRNLEPLFQDAPLDSGYSIDNLIPGPPTGAVVQFAATGASLTWEPSVAPDVQYFRVYRGSIPGFLPGPGNLVQTTAATAWNDPSGLAADVYKVTAVDFNGNQSMPTTASGSVGVGDANVMRTAITGIAPNPVLQGTVIRFELGSGARVELEVLDLAGRVIRRIAAGARPAGRYDQQWDGRDVRGERVAAGLYLVRLTAGPFRDTRRVVVTR